MKVVDFDGNVLDATFSVHAVDGHQVSIVFESSGGHEGGPNPRNLQYRQGLNVLLRRLQMMSAVVSEIRVETERTRLLPIEGQRLEMPGRSFPISLAQVEDVDVLRKQVSRYGRKVGQTPEQAAESGGSSRRLRIFLTGIEFDQAELERRLAGRGADPNATAVETVVEIAAGRYRGRGQGFLISHAMRNAIELYAVQWAVRHYELRGWAVADVGGTESFDLLCTRAGDSLHVEVKGTTTAGESVILTRNEVLHSQDPDTEVELFVVTDIHVNEPTSEHPFASGGVARVRTRWVAEEDDLTPVGYHYRTRLIDPGASADWSSVALPDTESIS